ncbi:MAG: tetratricopeptide repeat protein, partial [Gammaproteobacteria bacterium]
MRHACRGSIVEDPMMPAVRMFNRARNLTLVLGAVAMAGAALLAGCAAVRPARPSSPPAGSPMSDASAQTVMAEVALKRGDCRAASESYAKAAASSADVPLVRRATQVAMACEHLPAAWAAATRWHALAPQDREGNALYAAVALKLYHTADARTAIREFWRSEERASVATAPASKAGGPEPATGQDAAGHDPATGNASPSVPGGASAAVRPAQRAARGMGELMALLLEESDAPAVLMAMSGALEPSAHTPETLTLLGELALAAYDAQRAQEYAEQALQHDPKDAAALRVLARAYVVHGDASQALATARK